MSDYKVEMINDGMHEFYVHFHGPKDSNLLFSQNSIFDLFFVVLRCLIDGFLLDFTLNVIYYVVLYMVMHILCAFLIVKMKHKLMAI